MKNPIQPNIKTEIFAYLIIALSLLAAIYFNVSTLYFLPLLIILIYLMFIIFPYFKINHHESAILKEDWHRVKDLSLSFMFTIQIVGLLIFSGAKRSLLWSLPILLFLLLVSFLIEARKIIKYRHK